MAGQNTLFADKKELGNEFGGTLMAAPATYFLCLSTDAPGVNATKDGGTFTEVANSNGYARVSVTNNTTNFPAATGVSGTDVKATMTAGGPFNFPTPTGSWGTVNGFFISDSGTYGAGNIWYYDDLTTPQTVASGNAVSFAAGSLIVTEQ